jgi:MFS family permease
VDPAQRRLLWLLGLAIFFEGYGRTLINVTLPYVGEDMHAVPSELSYALALVTCGSFGVLVLGPIADRMGRRRLLLVSVALLALFGATTALARTLGTLVVWQGVARMFQEGALFTAAVIAAEEMPAGRRGTAQGLLGTVNASGAGFGAFLLAFIAWSPGGWRGLFVLSVIPVAFLPFLRRALPESRRWLARTEVAVHLPPPAYRGRVLAALAVTFLGMSYDVAGFTFTTYLPITRYAWSPAAVSAMFIVAGGIGLPGWWLGGELADRRGRRITAGLFLIGLSVAEVAFYLGGPSALWPAFAAMVFFQGGKMTVLRSWATELFPTSFRGAATAWLTAAGTLGGTCGLALAGALAPALGGIEVALAVIASAGVLGAGAAFLWLPETRGVELEAIAPEVT